MEKSMLTPAEICEYTENAGVKKAHNKFMQTLILGILAGAFIALGGFSAGVASHSIQNVGVAKLVAGAVFPVGLMLVLICGAELFTGNCLLSVALVQKKISLKEMAKNLTIVFFGNLIGAVIIVFLIVQAGLLDINNGMFGAYVIKVAAGKCNLTFTQVLSSGILCNIVVAVAVWGSYAAKDVVGKVFIGFFPIMAFVIAGFEHCVANMYYLTIGLIAKSNATYVELAHSQMHTAPEKISKIDITHIIANLIPATIGNIIGGSIFIGLAYWAVYQYSNSQNTNKTGKKVA